jgi:hypothetical protein
MSIARSLFRPRRGQTVAKYTAAVSDGVIYPGDWVALSTVVPTSQGVSGVMFGETLGATDYLECTLTALANLGSGYLTLGVCMGKGIGAVSNWANVTSQVLADQDIAIIQSWGVHPAGRQLTGGVLGDYLTITAVTGEMDGIVSAAATNALRPAGICLANTTLTLTRVTTNDEDVSPVFVTCF